jgi:exosortase
VSNPDPITGRKESLGAALAAFWRDLPSKGLFLALLIAWAALFYFLGNSTLGYIKTSSLFGWWVWVMTGGAIERDGLRLSMIFDGDEAHAWFVPVVVLVLLWWKRKELLSLPQRAWWPALGLLALGLLVHVLGYSIQQTRISLLAFFIGLYAVVGLTWGPQWLRATFFPLVLLGFCVPLGNAAEKITFPMRMLVAQLSVWTGHHVLGIDVIQDGSRIFDSQHTFQYDVAPACSGIRSLVALLALTTIYGFVTFRTSWKRWLMVFLAFPLAIVGNTMRITCVIIAGEAFGQQAGATIEQKLGFVTFAVALVVVLALGHWLSDDRPRRGLGTKDRPDSPLGPETKAAPAEPTI